MSIELVIPSNHPILCCRLLIVPSIFPSIRVFSNDSVLHNILGGQNIGAPASASVLPMKIQNWFPLLVWIPCSPRDSQKSSLTPQFKRITYLALSFLYGPSLTYILTTGKTIALTRRTFVAKGISLPFFFLIYFNWRLINLQYCGGFCHTFTWIRHGCTCDPILNPLPSSLLTHSSGSSHVPALSNLSHAWNIW